MFYKLIKDNLMELAKMLVKDTLLIYQREEEPTEELMA